jgi:hypothetical protein
MVRKVDVHRHASIDCSYGSMTFFDGSEKRFSILQLMLISVTLKAHSMLRSPLINYKVVETNTKNALLVSGILKVHQTYLLPR